MQTYFSFYKIIIIHWLTINSFLNKFLTLSHTSIHFFQQFFIKNEEIHIFVIAIEMFIICVHLRKFYI